MIDTVKALTFLLTAMNMISPLAAADLPKADLPPKNRIVCPVDYPKEHLQGIAGNGQYIYWVFSKHLLKTDLTGKPVKSVPLHREQGKVIHGGSPALLDKLYVPYSGSGFNRKLNGKPSLNYVQIYDLDLNYIRSVHVPELEFGAGAMTTDGKNFFITGGRPNDMTGNEIYEYDKDFKLLKKHQLSFNTFKGIQTLAFDGKYFYAGCYGSEFLTYRISRDFKKVDYMALYTYVGVAPLQGNRLLAAGIDLNAEGREETFVQVIDPERYLQKTAVLVLNEKRELFYGGKKVRPSQLRNLILKEKCDFTVLRCLADTPLDKILEIQVFIPGRFIIELYK